MTDDTIPAETTEPQSLQPVQTPTSLSDDEHQAIADAKAEGHDLAKLIHDAIAKAKEAL